MRASGLLSLLGGAALSLLAFCHPPAPGSRGFGSRLYLPARQWQQTDGNFGVIIGVAVPSPAIN